MLWAFCTSLTVIVISSCDSDRIVAPEVTLRLLPEAPNLFVGSIIRLSPFDVAGTPSTDPALKWSSSAPGVASVDAAGRITGKSIGSATIRVISATGFGEVMVTVSGGGASVRSWGSTTCGVASAGDLYCWGLNDFGQTGTGNRNTPVQVPIKVAGGLTFTSVAPALEHTCGIATSGTYCWGNNWAGQVGDGTSDGVRLAPTKVATGEVFTQVSTQSNNQSRFILDCSERICVARSCGITAAGTLFCWGDMTLLPGSAGLAKPFGAISLGLHYVCGLDRANLAYCWGRSDSKQTSGFLIAGTQPPPVPGNRYFQSISTGFSHNCALDFDGDVYCWGANDAGQLGAPSSETCGISFPIFYIQCRGVPVRVEADYKFLSVTVAGRHTCAIATTLQVLCWGSNSSGQLGSASGPSSQAPVPVPNAQRFRSVTAGLGHTCAVTLDGDAYCWGFNSSGQLGNGTITSSSVPTLVTGGFKFR